MEKEYSSVNFCREFILLVNAVPDAIIVIDKSGSIVLWNKAAELIMGYDAGEVLGQNFIMLIRDLIKKEKHEEVAVKFSDFLSNKTGPENSFFTRGIIKRKDNTEFIADVSISPGDIDGKQYAVCVARDISKVVEAENEAHYLSNIVKSSNDAIIGLDLNQIITSWNRGAEKIYGYSASEIIGESILKTVPEGRGSEIMAEIEKIKKDHSMRIFETERITKSGKRIKLLITISPIKDKFDSIVGASLIASDITREKEMFGTMINYISEAAMRLKNPAEMVQLNLLNIIDAIKADQIDKENLILNLSIQMKNTEQIVHNLRELNQALIGSYEEIPEDYVKYFNC